jgi:hypothetical protein
LSNEDPADATSDGDEDGLTALEEFDRDTDPTKADTDGDTLSDKVESNTGTFVSAEDTGTDPNSTDTDDDGLADNVETNSGTFIGEADSGTNPLSKDTDGDGIRDNTEIGLGSDPTDKDSVPGGSGGGDIAYGEPDGGWDEAYEGNVNPLELDWNHNNGSDEWDESKITEDDGEPGGVEIFTEGGIDFMRLQDTVTEGGTGNNRKVTLTKPVLEEGEDPLDADDGGVTLHFRLRLSTGPDLSDAENWLEGGDGSPVRFGGKGMVVYGSTVGNFGFALGTPDGDEAFDEPSLMLNGLVGIDDRDNFHPVLDPTQWQEFWATIQPDPDAEEGSHKVSLWHNGAADPVEYEVGLTGTGDISGDPEPSLSIGHPATDQIGAFDLDFFHLKAGLFAPVSKTGGPIFQITDVDCDFAARSCTILWTASANATYTVEVSQGPVPFVWLELADGVESDGETGTFTENGIPADANVRYYRVREEE